MKIKETKMLEVFDLAIPKGQENGEGVNQVYFTERGVVVTNRFALVCKDYDVVFEKLEEGEIEALKEKWISVKDYKTAVNNDLDIVDGRIIDDWGDVDIELHEARKGFLKSLYDMIDTVTDPKSEPTVNFVAEKPYFNKVLELIDSNDVEIRSKKTSDGSAFVGLFNTDGEANKEIGILHCRIR